MNKQNLFRCAIVSLVIAIVFSLSSITGSTVSIQPEDLDVTVLREQSLEQAAQWSETNATNRRGFAAIMHSFTYPGFWVFWFRGFMLLFVSVFVGTVSVTVWNERK